MADGILCIHCGYQNTDHGLVDLKFAMINENKIQTGYKMSLKQCMDTKGYGYTPDVSWYSTVDLLDADPNCEHVVVDVLGGGVKCSKCTGWFCY